MDNTENEVKTEQIETNKATENQPEQVVEKGKKSSLGLKIGIGAIAAVLVIGGVSFFAMGGTDRMRFNRNLSSANRYLEELDYEQAIAYFEEAIGIDPKSEEAYLGLADIYIEQEEYEKAIEILEEGLAQTGSEAISSKLEEVEELLAEREKAAEELLAMGEEAPAEEEVPEEEAEEPAEEAAAAGRVPYADEMAAIADASVGDIVYWGSYEQDNDPENGTEPVEWYVLDKADGEATLLAVYLLDWQQYHEAGGDITWENCTLRSWLNREFYNMAFSEEEQAAIVNTNVVNEDNPYCGTEGGNDTTDKVWLLSLGEMERYFHIDMNVYDDYINGNMSWNEYAIYCYGRDNRVCAKPTAYAGRVYVYSEENIRYGIEMSYAIGSGWWWLRSPGYCSYYVAYVSGEGGVSDDGSVRNFGNVVNCHGVRPALKVAY